MKPYGLCSDSSRNLKTMINLYTGIPRYKKEEKKMIKEKLEALAKRNPNADTIVISRLNFISLIKEMYGTISVGGIRVFTREDLNESQAEIWSPDKIHREEI